MILNAHINKPLINPETMRAKLNNKYKQTMLADAGYYNKYIIRSLKKKGYKPIIDVNIRRTKNEKLLLKMKKDKILYEKNKNKRLAVERCNSWIHKYPKLTRVVEKTSSSFKGILLLALSFTVNNKIN